MSALRVLLVHPGCDISVSDVHAGVSDGLRAAGCEVHDYALNTRIEAASAYLYSVWRQGKKQAEKPSDGQVLFKAGSDLVVKALSVMPDVVLIVSAMYLHPNVIELLRRAGLKVAILFTESPYMDESQARLVPATVVSWTNERTSAAAMGCRYLRHAWHPEIHRPSDRRDDPAVPAHDVVFVGTAFQERIDLLEAVDWTGIDLALYGEWGLLSKRSPLRKRVKEGYIPNAHAAALYQRAKIGLNLYRTSKGFGKVAHVTTAESLNPRAYELAATGCFSISNYRPEVAEVFGASVPTFRTPGELRPLLDRWLADDVGRARLTQHAQHAVASDTWRVRALEMLFHLTDAGIVARGDSPTHAVAAAAGVGGG